MNVNEKIENVLWKYFEGQTIENEDKQISAWLDESKQNRQLFSVMKKAYVEIEVDALHDNVKVEEAYQRFIGYIDKHQNVISSDGHDKRTFIRSVLIRYAAAAAIIIGVGLSAYFIGNRLPFFINNKQYVVEVPYGSRTSIILQDGSKIWLNAGSKLSYGNDFGRRNRDVYLEGEGFFEVTKTDQPFIVHTSHFNIKVLGTSFNVKSYPDDNRIETILIEGNIMIERKESDKPLYLKPKEKLTYKKSSRQFKISSERKTQPEKKDDKYGSEDLDKIKERHVYITRNVNTDEYTSWMNGKLIINDEPLEDLTKKLERKYDIEFKFKDEKLKHYAYSGTLRDIPLEQVLEALELTSPVLYSIREKTVWLSYNKKFNPQNLMEDVIDE